MFKKIIYPFTDWAWLKLTAAVAVVTCLLVGFLVLVFGSAIFWESGDDVAAHLSAASTILMVTVGLLSLIFAGYLKRVARQPEIDAYRLPKLNSPLSLIKEGLLTLLGSLLSTWVVGFLLTMTVLICGLVCTSLAGLISSEVSSPVMIVGLIGASVVQLIVAILFLIWIGFFAPLLAVRYSYTGRFRSFFEFRWAWNAFTIAPFEYIARTMAWSVLLVVITILTPLTAGFAWVLSYILGPYSTINCAYLIGDYYHTYLND
jgi:hypothetical protein